MRDYSFSHVQLEYQEYGQGILRGCGIQVQGDELIVGPGMIKYGQFICLMMEEQRIGYQPAEQMQYLKLRIEIDRRSPDYIAYQINLALDLNEKQAENEFELCRFNLRKGAQLRDHYKDFSDMETEYDTVNVLHADWGGLGGKTLAPGITRLFSKEMLASGNIRPEDRSFAYLCLSQPGAVPAPVLNDYIYCKTQEGEMLPEKNLVLYEKMCDILMEAGQDSSGREKKSKERRRILVD